MPALLRLGMHLQRLQPPPPALQPLHPHHVHVPAVQPALRVDLDVRCHKRRVEQRPHLQRILLQLPVWGETGVRLAAGVWLARQRQRQLAPKLGQQRQVRPWWEVLQPDGNALLSPSSSPTATGSCCSMTIACCQLRGPAGR
eukprot:GHRQ01017911.1.p3 GENE.GHRQ01017911.1~~GHRQ01017911.1.p3  ORF type:complete len:142 (-),score=27.80 GHRQ01017911.1:628-1053(-)